MVPALPFFIGKPGWVRSSAWIWDFSSTDSTMACSGGFQQPRRRRGVHQRPERNREREPRRYAVDQFYGPNHEEVGGLFIHDDTAGAFGANR